MKPSLIMRPATEDDAEWIVSQVPRLHEFGPPPWRTIEQMNAGEGADLRAALSRADDPDLLFVIAQRSEGTPLGFLYVDTLADFFTGERHAHIKDIVVAREGEGQGVGRALMDAAETWSRSRGHRLLTLSVFPDNKRAFELYGRLGFQTDVHRMLKVLD